MNPKRKKRIVFWLAGILILFLLLFLCCYFYITRNAIKVKSSQDIKPEQTVFYFQKDKRGSEDFLGNSKYTVGKSGCLVSCIASSLQMQGYRIEEQEVNPKSLNEEFSFKHIYDEEGNLQWQVLDDSYKEISVKKADEINSDVIDNYLKNGKYPIVMVRMRGIGNYHFVLIVGAEKGIYLCMDPLNQEQELVPLSRFGNKIYAVRCVILD